MRDEIAYVGAQAPPIDARHVWAANPMSLPHIRAQTRRWLAETPATALTMAGEWLPIAALAGLALLAVIALLVFVFERPMTAITLPLMAWAGLLLLRRGDALRDAVLDGHRVARVVGGDHLAPRPALVPVLQHRHQRLVRDPLARDREDRFPTARARS